MKDLEEIKKEAREHNVPVMLDDGMTFLLDYIRKNVWIQDILEIGTAVGLSSMEMAKIRESIHVDTIEINNEMYDQAVINIKDNHLEDRIHVHSGDALDYFTNKKFDMIFVDAAKAQYRHYTEHFMNNAKVGSVFIYDNLKFHGMVDDPSLTNNRGTKQMIRKIKVFREWILENPDFESTYYPEVGDGIVIAKKK